MRRLTLVGLATILLAGCGGQAPADTPNLDKENRMAKTIADQRAKLEKADQLLGNASRLLGRCHDILTGR